MLNVGGPSQCKRSLLMSVVHTKILHAALIWANTAGGAARNRELLSQAQRHAAIHIIQSYKTIPDTAAAALVLLPAHSLINES